MRTVSYGGETLCTKGGMTTNLELFYVDGGAPHCVGLGGVCNAPSMQKRTPSNGWFVLKNNYSHPSFKMYMDDDQGFTQGYMYERKGLEGIFTRSITCRSATVTLPPEVKEEPTKIGEDDPAGQCSSAVPCEHGVGPCNGDDECWGSRCFNREKADEQLNLRLPPEWPETWGVCWSRREPDPATPPASTLRSGRQGLDKLLRWPNAGTKHDICPDGWNKIIQPDLGNASTFSATGGLTERQRKVVKEEAERRRRAKQAAARPAAGAGSTSRSNAQRPAAATQLARINASSSSVVCPTCTGNPGKTGLEECKRFYDPEACDLVGCCQYIYCDVGIEKDRRGRCVSYVLDHENCEPDLTIESPVERNKDTV